MRKITISISLVAMALGACDSSPASTKETATAKTAQTSAERSARGAPEPKPTFEAPKSEVVPAAVLPTSTKLELPPEEPKARVTEAIDDGICRVALNRLEMASDIAKREPVLLGEKATANGEAIYAFTDFENTGEGPESVRVEWTHPSSGHYFAYDVEVGKHKRYRTWTRHRIPARREGTWNVRVKDADGCLIGETSFEAAPEDFTHDH
jgi:glucose/arabinose dehydrogenase